MKKKCFIIFGGKKWSTLLIASLFGLAAQAQTVPNGNFESTFSDTSGNEFPQNWTIDTYGAGLSTANNGSWGLGVWNWYYYAKGYAANGNFPAWNFEKAGTPLAVKATALNGFYLYNDAGAMTYNDSAIVRVLLKKWNGTSADTVGFGELHLAGDSTTSTFSPFTVNITDMSPGVDPDSIVVYIQSSVNGFCHNNTFGTCLYFTIDDLTLSTPNGVVEQSDWANATQIFPNPATDKINISGNAQIKKMRLTDINGRIVMEKENPGKVIDVTNILPGVYQLCLEDSERNIKNEKLIISR